MPGHDPSTSEGDGPQPPWSHQRFANYSAAETETPPTGTSVLFLVDSLTPSGGTGVVVRYAQHAARLGWDVTVAVVGNGQPQSITIEGVRVKPLAMCVGTHYDVVIPTWWATVYALPELSFTMALYLVLSVESRFYEDHLDQRLRDRASATYGFGLPVLTVSTWIQAYLAFVHEAPSFLVLNGIDKSLFSPSGDVASPKTDDRLRVIVEGRLATPMKGVAEALEACSQAEIEDVWLLSPDAPAQLEGVTQVFSNVPRRDVARIYRSCDVLLKLSRVEGMYAPPLEMMHCGGTVVTWPTTGSEEYVQHRENGIVVPMEDIDAAADALRELREDGALLARLKAGGLSTAAGWPSEEEAARRFCNVLAIVAKQPSLDADAIRQRIAAADRAH
jgi:glycosyltransferase involved in cell wall biosynthesis